MALSSCLWSLQWFQLYSLLFAFKEMYPEKRTNSILSYFRNKILPVCRERCRDNVCCRPNTFPHTSQGKSWSLNFQDGNPFPVSSPIFSVSVPPQKRKKNVILLLVSQRHSQFCLLCLAGYITGNKRKLFRSQWIWFRLCKTINPVKNL